MPSPAIPSTIKNTDPSWVDQKDGVFVGPVPMCRHRSGDLTLHVWDIAADPSGTRSLCGTSTEESIGYLSDPNAVGERTFKICPRCRRLWKEKNT